MSVRIKIDGIQSPLMREAYYERGWADAINDITASLVGTNGKPRLLEASSNNALRSHRIGQLKALYGGGHDQDSM